MKNNYQPVIGLEVHVELNTKTKMFCSCSAEYFGRKPNSHTCPVCLGLPGALPYINKEAIEKCMMVGLALNCEISESSLFERKNYFYPDLPKGYQISQYRFPLCKDGFLEIGSEKRKIRINRVHQEEDTGKLMHIEGGTAVDLNRAGVPLVEIVTEPDFTDSTQVREFAKKLQTIFKDLKVSNADMEKGNMRLEANVSVRRSDKSDKSQPEADRPLDEDEIGSFELPNYRVELKNINSFKFMAEAIEYEIKRQIEVLESGGRLVQETRGWSENKKETYSQRSKEEAHDYRYFPEPDLPRLSIKGEAERVKEKMPKLGEQVVEEIVSKYGLSEASASTLVSKGLVEIFEEIVGLGEKEGIEAKQISNMLINKNLGDISADEVIKEVIAAKVGVIDNEEDIERMAREVITENPKMVEDYKKGKESVLQALLGKVMRKSAGKVNTSKAIEILKKLLQN